MNQRSRTYPGILSSAIILMLMVLMLSGCNALKYVPEDKKLYTGGSVNVESKGFIKGKAALRKKTNGVIGPEPNSRFLWMRIGLWSHYKLARGDSGFIPRFINDKFGEAPVYLSDVNVEENEDLIINRAENSGFFYTTISSEIKEKKRTASITYTLETGEPYTLETYTYTRDSLPMDKLISNYIQQTKLEQGSRFDLDEFKAERQRIDEHLKNNGYYMFNPDYLIFTSDTNQYSDRRYDLYLTMKDAVPSKAQIPYKINRIQVFPNYSLAKSSDKPVDTNKIGDIQFIQDTVIFKPDLLYDYLDYNKGDRYNKEEDELTTRRLSIMPIYQFVGIQYTVDDTTATDSVGWLHSSIRLTPGQQHALRARAQAVTKSNSFAGPGISSTYRNRNLFKGGEVLDITGNISYEFQVAGGSAKNLAALQFRLNNSITFPRFIGPISINPDAKYTIPNTKFALNYAFQDRGRFYRLNSFFFSYGFNWNSSRFIFQELTPLSITYTLIAQKTDRFMDILDRNPFLAKNFENQFIPAILYTFQYSEVGEVDKASVFYFNFDADAAGNITGALHKVTNQEPHFFGTPYAQYLKGDVDFRYYYNFTEDRQLANRLFVGVGYPYGNSVSLPYIKQFFAGGPNSIRAFRIRSLGPGSYQPNLDNTELSFFDQSGDIRLEVNTEYRFNMSGMLDGAVFIDAGNIWLVNNNPAIPGGEFSSGWMKEIAIGTGYGFRLDLQFLVIRLDLAFPLRYPYEKDGSHWQMEYDFWTIDWISDNLVFNFAIGYPF